MDIIKVEPVGVTLSFTEKELTHLLFLVQEGRTVLECTNPEGRALDDGLKAASDKLYLAGSGEKVH